MIALILASDIQWPEALPWMVVAICFTIIAGMKIFYDKDDD